MKRTYIHTLMGSLLLLGALAACNDKQMCDLPHPHPGRAVLTYDWGTTTPREVQLEVLAYDDGQGLHPTDSPSDLEQLAPGRYHAFAYTPGAENLGVEHGTATVTGETDGYLPSVGDLWAGYADFVVQSEENTEAAVDLNPCTRQLELALRIAAGETGRVQAISATLQGVLRQRVIDPLLEQAYSRAATNPAGSIRLDFALNEDGTAYVASHRLLGFATGTRLTLALTVTDADGQSDTQDFDLTEELEDFDTSGSFPSDAFELDADITLPETPDPEPEPEPEPDPEPASPLFGISGWTPADGTTGDAGMEL